MVIRGGSKGFPFLFRIYMSIQHKLIPEAHLHEVKGASLASAGQYLVSDGVGGTTFVTKTITYSIVLTPVSVAANSIVEQTFTLASVISLTDTIIGIKKNPQTGLGIVGERVVSDDLIGITYINNTGAPIVPTVETYKIVILRE